MGYNYIKRLKSFWEVPSFKKACFEKVIINQTVKKLKTNKEKEDYWNTITEKHKQQIIKNIPIEKEWSVLEIGCGVGRLIKSFSPFVSFISGVDISESMINYSKEYLKYVNNAQTINNNGKDLKFFEDATFNFVYSIITFQHIRSYQIVQNYFNEAYRVLIPKGYFKFQVRKYSSIGNFGKYFEEPKEKINYKFAGNAYTYEELKIMLSKSCFTMITIDNSSENNIWVTAQKQGDKK